MKKNKSGFTIAVILMIFMIGFISVMSVRISKREGYANMSFGFSFGGIAKLRNTIEIPLEKAERLKLEYGSKNIKVYPAEDGQITIKEFLCSGAPEALAAVQYDDERQVTVTGGRHQSFVFFGFFMGEGERIEVYIPEKSLKELSVETGSGNITSKTDCLKEDGILTIQAGSGNITFGNARAKELSLEAHSGNIKAEEAVGENIWIEANSGNIYAEKLAGTIGLQTGSGNISGKEITGGICAESGSGNIGIEELSGSGSAKAGSGNVTIEAEKVSGDMELQTRSGGIRLELPGELEFHFKGNTGSGNIHTDFDEFLSYDKKGKNAEGDIGAHPSVKITAGTGSGNITVQYK